MMYKNILEWTLIRDEAQVDWYTCGTRQSIEATDIKVISLKKRPLIHLFQHWHLSSPFCSYIRRVVLFQNERAEGTRTRVSVDCTKAANISLPIDFLVSSLSCLF